MGPTEDDDDGRAAGAFVVDVPAVGVIVMVDPALRANLKVKRGGMKVGDRNRFASVRRPVRGRVAFGVVVVVVIVDVVVAICGCGAAATGVLPTYGGGGGRVAVRETAVTVGCSNDCSVGNGS